MSMISRQAVIITRLADRHEGPDRDFAQSRQVVVDAGDLATVLTSACADDGVIGLGPGRYHIEITEPYDEIKR